MTKSLFRPRVLPGFSIIGSNWLLHMAVLSCTVIGRVNLVAPWLLSRWRPDTLNKHGRDYGITWRGEAYFNVNVLLKFCSELLTQWYVYFFASLNVRLAFTAPQDLHFRHLQCMHAHAERTISATIGRHRKMRNFPKPAGRLTETSLSQNNFHRFPLFGKIVR